MAVASSTQTYRRSELVRSRSCHILYSSQSSSHHEIDSPHHPSVPAAVQAESIWLEAEHLEGIRGYCWPAGRPAMKKTDGHWGLSGPGWAAEWTQGGESGFLSIACGADDDKAVASTNRRYSRKGRIPRLGPLPRESRYDQPLSRTANAQGRRDRNADLRPKAQHRRRQRDEALLELGIRLGRARCRIASRSTSNLELASGFKEKECRQIDCLVLTTDLNYQPAHQGTAAASDAGVIGSIRRQSGKPLEPLARRMPKLDIRLRRGSRARFATGAFSICGT